MNLLDASQGAISGTGILKIHSKLVGGVLISTNNTNAATVVLRKKDATGPVILSVSTITSRPVFGKFPTGESCDVYYSITGTGASAQIFEAQV